MSRLYDRIVKADPKPLTKKQHEVAEMKRLATMPEAEFQKELARGRGRPLSGKETVTLRVESDVVAFFRTYGDNWKQAMVAALRKTAHL